MHQPDYGFHKHAAPAGKPGHAFTHKHAKTHAHLHDLGVSRLICTMVVQIRLPKV